MKSEQPQWDFPFKTEFNIVSCNVGLGHSFQLFSRFIPSAGFYTDRGVDEKISLLGIVDFGCSEQLTDDEGFSHIAG